MTKFKKGDTVKILKSMIDGVPHDGSQEFVGRVGRIVSIDSSAAFPYEVSVMGMGKQDFEGPDLKLLKNGKEPKVNFLLQYELESDPVEPFETEQEVKDRIKELSERSDLQEDSLVVYDVSRVRKITLKRELVIEGL
jgi:hypothetical protein